MNPLTVDISDFYGQPPYGQQSTDLIVDKRKTLYVLCSILRIIM